MSIKRLPARDGLEDMVQIIDSIPARARALNVTFVYEDEQTRDWLREVCPILPVRTRTSLNCTWWRLKELDHAGVLAGAVSQALRADVVAVAVRGSEGLPLPFYVWVNNWLPHRVRGSGVLLAMLEGPSRRNAHSRRLRGYLRTVANQGGMNFILEERAPENRTALIESATPILLPRLRRGMVSRRAGAAGRGQNAAANASWLRLAKGELARWGEI